MLLETPAPEFGSKAPDFTLKDPSGHAFTLSDVAGPKGILVAFICNHCPYVIGIANRLAQDINTLRDAGIGTVLINANDYRAYPQDAPEHMPAFAKKHGLIAPYLIDETQEIAHAYGAVCTPDFFGYDTNFELQYRGRLDNAGRGDASGRAAELRDAMIAIANGQQRPDTQVPSMGCSLKWR